MFSFSGIASSHRGRQGENISVIKNTPVQARDRGLRGKNTVNDGVQNPNLKKGWGKRPPPLSPPVEKEQTHRERPPAPQTLSVRRRRKTEMLSFPPGGGDADSQEAAPPILMTRFSSAMR